jgi:hypothetical protein
MVLSRIFPVPAAAGLIEIVSDVERGVVSDACADSTIVANEAYPQNRQYC